MPGQRRRVPDRHEPDVALQQFLFRRVTLVDRQWTAAPVSVSGLIGAPGTIHAIAFASAEGGCNSYAYGNRGGEIYLTRDGGVTWTDLDPTNMLPARPINSIVFDPASAAIAYVALSSFNDGTPEGRDTSSNRPMRCRRRRPGRTSARRPTCPSTCSRSTRAIPTCCTRAATRACGRARTVGRPGTSRGWCRDPQRADLRHPDQSHDRHHDRVHLRSRRVSAGDGGDHGPPSLEPASAIGARRYR